MKAAWLDYAKTLYEAVSPYENFYGGFITWEDFWNYVEDAPGQFALTQSGIDEARRIGFQAYLESRYTIEEVNRYFAPDKTFQSFDQVSIPKKDSPAYKLFFEYYDEFLNGLLTETQQVFPNLSM